MYLGDGVPQSRLVPVVRKPHVGGVHKDTHNWIEEKVGPCPPSGPDNELSGDNGVQAGKTEQTDAPDINVDASFIHNMVFLVDPKRNDKDDDAVSEP